MEMDTALLRDGKFMDRSVLIWLTPKPIPHEDLVSQGVAQNHSHELPVPGALDKLAALAAGVGVVILEGEGNPYRLPP